MSHTLLFSVSWSHEAGQLRREREQLSLTLVCGLLLGWVLATRNESGTEI